MSKGMRGEQPGWGRGSQEVRAGEEGGEATRVERLNFTVRAVRGFGPWIVEILFMFLKGHFNGHVKVNYL